MSTEIIYNTYDNEASIVHDNIVNDKVLKVVTSSFGNSNTKDVLEYPLAENLLEVQSYGFSQFIKTSFLVRKAEVILNIDDEDIVVAEAENIEMNHWYRLEGFFTMDELKKVDFNNATLRLRITKAFNDPEVYIYRPCLTKGDTIPDWFPSLEEIMGDIVESQSLISADRRLENLASDLNETEQDEIKSKLAIDLSKVIEKLEGDAESGFLLRADGTRINPQTLIEEKEVVTYNSSNPRPSTGEEGKLYIDTDTDKAYLWDETTQDYVGIGVIDLSNYYDKQEVDGLLGVKGGELKKIGNGYGLQHQIDNPNNYGTLGQDAINLSFSSSVGDYGATGKNSHAEGLLTKASSNNSHAEGFKTTASSAASHAEGFSTIASGSYSHAEGNNTVASGGGSHAEGYNTTASGSYSHAEGRDTTAGSYAENARGTYNEVITPISAQTFNSNDVIESVGVGTNSSNRKNALTRWKNGAFKWLLQPLTNITNAVLGFHAADENGRLNYHNGTEWKKYLIEGEEGTEVDLSNYYDQQEVDGLLVNKEDAFTKNTAFNKNFGTGSNDVAEGNHTHSELHTHSNKGVLDTITADDLVDYFEAHQKTVTGVSFTGDVNKTLTITRLDGTTLTASFVDKEGDGGGVTDGVLNTLEFNTTTGVLTATVLNGTTEVPIDVIFDGRYSLITHTHQLSDINGLQDALDSKVDKVAGKELSDNNFSTQEKNKLASLENFDDSAIQSELDTKVDKVVGKGLSDENYTLAEKDKLGGIEVGATANSTDAQLRDRTTHTGVQPIASVDGLQDALDEKVDNTDSRLTNAREWTASVVTQPEAEAGTSTTARKWTSQRVRQAILGWWNNSIFKTKLDGIEDGATANATDAQLRDRATHTGVQPISSVTNLQSSLDSKVDKQAGMGLSSNDFTTAEKQKLAGLEEPNYRGTFATETSIQDLTDPKPGNYALLDLGVGEDVVPYFYDVTDGMWVPGGGSTELTPAQLKSLYESNPDTNAFTDTEKTKLSGIATQATKNQTDTYLRNRANHTGSQAMSTITGLSGALDSKVGLLGDEDIAGKKTFSTVPASSQDAAAGNDLIRKSQWDAYNTQAESDVIQGLAGKEPKFTKNTAFNKNFGTTSTTVARGNDSRFHAHSNKTVLDGITSAKVSDWNDVYSAYSTKLLMGSNFENAQYEVYGDPADHPYFLMGGGGRGVAVASPEQAKEQLNISLQYLINDSIADHPDGYLDLTFKDGGYVHWAFPANGFIEVDKDSFNIIADITTLTGDKGTLLLGPLGNIFSDKNPSPKGIQYENDYSGTYTNRSLVDKGYVDKAISEIPNTNNDNKWFIGSKANPLDTPTIEIDTQGLMQGHEIVITYERAGQVELPLIVSSRPNVKIELYSIDDSVNFEGGGAMNRIYLHLTEAIEDDTYQFDITAGKINTYANV